MKVNQHQSVKSIIELKKSQSKQILGENKVMFDAIKNRKEHDRITEDKIMKSIGLKKKDLKEMQIKVKKDHDRSVELFRKIKRPKKAGNKSVLLQFAKSRKSGGRGTPSPRPTPTRNIPDITQDVCFASANSCQGDFCDFTASTLFPTFESDSVGGYFGSNATVSPADRSNSLFYQFLPLENGTATILVEVLLTGVITAATSALYGLNFFFPFFARSTADVTFGLRMNIWQGNSIINTTDLPIVNVHCQDGDSSYKAFNDDLFILTTSTIVTQDEEIVIELMAVANLVGRSMWGVATVDFSKGQKLGNNDFGIRVPQLCVFVDSPVVNPL